MKYKNRELLRKKWVRKRLTRERSNTGTFKNGNVQKRERSKSRIIKKRNGRNGRGDRNGMVTGTVKERKNYIKISSYLEFPLFEFKLF